MERPGFVFEESVYNLRSAEQVLSYLFPLFDPQSVVDFGCGLGTWLKMAKRLGAIDILGIDCEDIPLHQLHISKNDLLIYDLRRPLDLEKKFDLAGR